MTVAPPLSASSIIIVLSFDKFFKACLSKNGMLLLVFDVVHVSGIFSSDSTSRFKCRSLVCGGTKLDGFLTKELFVQCCLPWKWSRSRSLLPNSYKSSFNSLSFFSGVGVNFKLFFNSSISCDKSSHSVSCDEISQREIQDDSPNVQQILTTISEKLEKIDTSLQQILTQQIN